MTKFLYSAKGASPDFAASVQKAAPKRRPGRDRNVEEASCLFSFSANPQDAASTFNRCLAVFSITPLRAAENPAADKPATRTAIPEANPECRSYKDEAG